MFKHTCVKQYFYFDSKITIYKYTTNSRNRKQRNPSRRLNFAKGLFCFQCSLGQLCVWYAARTLLISGL